MNKSWNVICLGLQTSLNSKHIDLPSDIDWGNVLEEAKKQEVVSLLYSGVKPFLDFETKSLWNNYVLTSISDCVQITRVVETFVADMKNADIPFSIIKGVSASVYYPEPLFRSMGDIDFLVPAIFFEKAKNYLLSIGYVLDQSEIDNPRNIVLEKYDVKFEMHHYFIQENAGVDFYLNKCWGKMTRGNVNEVEFPMLPPLENGLVILEHLHHHIYSGIGLRQIIDWMMYVKMELSDDLWYSSFREIAKELGIEKLAKVTTRLCQIHFGLTNEVTWCADADPKLCERMLDYIIQSGNFGKSLGDGKAVTSTIIKFRRIGGLKYLQTAGEYNWKYYHKHKWARPFAWVYQIGRYTRQVLQTKRNGLVIKNDLDMSSTRYSLLKELEL